MAKLFANSGDPDQMPCSTASDLGLHCLPITLLRVSRLQWVNIVYSIHQSCKRMTIFVGLEFNGLVNTIKVMSRQSVYLSTFFLGRLCPLSS